MRLIRCNVENFGVLSGESREFTDGLNCILAENGSGKSTLAAFVRVMLFGFENERRKDGYERERERYRPWQGGPYGGTLTFETGGKVYEVERSFGASAKDDGFALRDAVTRMESRDFSENLGEELFGIDSLSFKRTVFLSQNDCETSTTDAINAKIGDLADYTDDINNYENVSGRLKAALDELGRPIKSGGRKKNTLLYRLDNEITELKAKAARSVEPKAEALAEERRKLLERRGAVSAERGELTERQSAAVKTAKIREKKRQYDGLCDELRARRAAAQAAKAAFPAAVPDGEELNKRLRAAGELNAKAAEAARLRLSEDDEERLGRLKTRFAAGVPSEAELEAAVSAADALDDLRLKADERRLSEADASRLAELEKKFANGAPTADETEAALRLLDEPFRPAAPVWPAALLAVCAVLSAAAALAVGLALTPWGFGLFALTAVFAALAFAAARGGGFKSEGPLEARALLSRFGAPTDGELRGALYALKSDADEYRRLSGEMEKYASVLPEIAELEGELAALLEKYAAPAATDECPVAARALEAEANELGGLLKADAAASAAESEVAAAKADMAEYMRSLGLEPSADAYGQLLELNGALTRFSGCLDELRKAEKNKADFEADNDMAALEAELPEPEDMDGLAARLEELNSAEAEINKRLNDIDRDLDDLDGQRDEIEAAARELGEKTAEREEKLRRYDIYEKTAALLETAKNRLTSRYIGPITEGFRKYYSMLGGNGADSFDINSALEPKIKEAGALREARFLSAGRRDLVGICLRMALIDAMYDGEKPVIFLDDPFVNFDETRVAGGMSFLEKISREYQLLYFTCHGDRSVK